MSLARLVRLKLSGYPNEMIEDKALEIMESCGDDALICQDDLSWIAAAWFIAQEQLNRRKNNGGGRVIHITLTDALPLREMVG